MPRPGKSTPTIALPAPRAASLFSLIPCAFLSLSPPAAAQLAPVPLPPPTPLQPDARPSLPSQKTLRPRQLEPIEITSTGNTVFDTNKNTITYNGDVVLIIQNDDPDDETPRLRVSCDRLEVFLKESEKEPEPSPPEASPPRAIAIDPDAPVAAIPVDPDTPPEPPAPAPPAPALVTTIERAIATGATVTIERWDGPRKAKTAQSKLAIFHAETELLELRHLPEVQDGNSRIVSTSPETYMILHKDGSLDVYGAADTQLTSRRSGPN